MYRAGARPIDLKSYIGPNLSMEFPYSIDFRFQFFAIFGRQILVHRAQVQTGRTQLPSLIRIINKREYF